VEHFFEMTEVTHALDRNAAQATYLTKQERFRQRLNQYNERLRKRKAGATLPKRPEPPKPPSIN
jgi:hypothetical protein